MVKDHFLGVLAEFVRLINESWAREGPQFCQDN